MHKYKMLFFNSWGKTVPYHTMLWLWLPISFLRKKNFWIWFLSFDSRTKEGDHHCRCNTYLSVLLFIMLGSLFVKKLISVLKCSKLATQITGRQMQAFRPGKSRVKIEIYQTANDWWRPSHSVHVVRCWLGIWQKSDY